MSDIPKSKRAKSSLEAQHKAINIRRMISVELLNSFAYNQKKLEAAIRKQTAYIQDPAHKEEAAAALRSLEEDYAGWFIKRHRDRVDDLCCAISQHLRAANTIWPNYRFEFNDRRHEMNQALKCCNMLQDELQYLAKIVYGIDGYGRYTDDFFAIGELKEYLQQVLNGFYRTADEYGLIINPRKTRIVKLSSEFRHLQISYSLTETGRVVRKINPKNITRERRKLKAYKRLLDAGTIDYMTVENSYKSWIGGHWKIMSHLQIYNMSNLYFELFRRRPTWKKGHSRLCWLMAHPPKTCAGTATTISAKPKSPKQPLPVTCPP